MGKVPGSSLPLAARRSLSVRESNPSFSSAESLQREVCSSQPSEAPAAAECYHSAPPKNPWRLGRMMMIRNGSRRDPSGKHQIHGKLQAVTEAETTVKVAAAGREPKWKRFLHRVKGGALKSGLAGIQTGDAARPHVKPRDSRLIWERRNVAQIAPLELRHDHAGRARARRPGLTFLDKKFKKIVYFHRLFLKFVGSPPTYKCEGRGVQGWRTLPRGFIFHKKSEYKLHITRLEDPSKRAYIS